jgi:hypothetical protein
MMINGFDDYLTAVEERRHFEELLQHGRKEFSGYGLELFERGLRGKIAKLTDAITQWDAQSSCDVTTSGWGETRDNLQTFVCTVVTQYVSNPSDFANLTNCVALNCNVVMLQGSVSLYPSVQVNPMYVHASVRPDILGLLSERGYRDRADARCYLPA